MFVIIEVSFNVLFIQRGLLSTLESIEIQIKYSWFRHHQRPMGLWSL